MNIIKIFTTFNNRKRENFLKGSGNKPPYPYDIITKEKRDDAYEKLKKYDCSNELNLSNIGNKASNYYFQPYRAKTKIGKWSHYSAWMDDEKREKVIEASKKLNRGKTNKSQNTQYRDALRLSIGSINQFKPYIAVCGIYKKFKPKRVLDTSAGWGDRLIGAMSQNIDYIGIDQNKKLITPYKKMIKDFKDKTTSEIIMIFEKSQDVDYSKLPKYDLIFTSPPYFDLEKYEGMEIFKDKNEFIEKYWRPTIEKAYKYLEKGGHIALNMPEEMYDAIKPVIGKADSKIKMPIQNRFNWKGDPPKFENIYVWKKISGGDNKCKYKIKIDKIKLNDGRKLNIIRDDLIKGGTKIRLLDKIIPKINNKILVYAGPRTGYAQLALSIIGKKYNKKVVIFVSKSKILSNPTLEAKNNGAIIKEVERPSYLNVVQSKAREWSKKNKAYLMPFGLDEGENIDILSNEIKKCLPENINTKSKINIWLVVGSGLILRSLYKVFTNANFNVVEVGKKLTDYNKNNTKVYTSPYDFDKKETILPPYPSVDNYDSKVWRFVLKYAKNNDYIYNIAG